MISKLIQSIADKIHVAVRVKPIGDAIASLFENEKTVLDVGCFDGGIDRYLQHNNPKLKITGVDIFLPERVMIPVKLYDGENLPFKTNSFDCVMFIDVLHHVKNPEKLLKEAKRVSKKSIIIKDVWYDSLFGYFSNLFVDLAGYLLLKINLPEKYFKKTEWDNVLKKLGLDVVSVDHSFKLMKLDLLPHIIVKLKSKQSGL